MLCKLLCHRYFTNPMVVRMASKLPIRQHVEPIAKIITDLDQSDKEREKPKKSSHHRHRDKKDFKSFGGNFINNRSKSAETRNGKGDGKCDLSYFKVLLQTKDEQIEKLVEKIADLHNYNNQFAQENERLQAEVSALTQTVQDLSKKLEDLEAEKCETCAELDKEREELIAVNKNLKDDLKMMKTLVYRLNVQLERHQDKLRKTFPSIEDIDRNSPSPSASCASRELDWGSVNNHTLAPLLNAYEEMLREKEDLVQQHEREINRFTGHLKEVIAENERLQQEMDDLRRGKDGWREDRTRLQAQLDICRSKAELQTRRADLAKEKLVEVLRCYEQKVQSQSLDLERLQDAYNRAKAELASVKNLHSQPEVVVESLKECQKLFEELKSQHEKDRADLSAELSECKKQKAELEEKYAEIKAENLTLKATGEKHQEVHDELRKKISALKDHLHQVKESRDRLKARLRIALQWAQKLEDTREKMKNTWKDLKELETIVRHKEAQIRGLHSRHSEEIEKLERKLEQREETIKNILKERSKTN